MKVFVLDYLTREPGGPKKFLMFFEDGKYLEVAETIELVY